MESLELESNDTVDQPNEPLQRMHALRFWYLALFLNPLYTLGILTNLVSIAVFWRLARRRQNHHFWLLSCLGLADSAYLLLMLEYTWPAWGLPLLELRSNLSCALLFYVRGVAGTSASLLLVVICAARLALILPSPQPGRLNVPMAALAVCVIALGVNVPRLISFRLRGGAVPCRSHHESQVSTILHMAAHLLFQRIGPAFLTFLLSSVLFLKIRKVLHPLNRHLRHQVRLTKTCIILGAAYVIFVLPPGIYWCLIYYWEISHSVSTALLQYHSIVGDMVSVTAALNSAINFPIYLFFLIEFRRHLHVLLARKMGADVEYSSSTSLETRTIAVPLEPRPNNGLI